MLRLTFLGEAITDIAEADQFVTAYKEVLAAVNSEKLDANISLKPTMFGLKLDREVCRANIQDVVEEAKRLNNFVRIDMEDRTCTTDTFDMYLDFKRKYPNCGTVIQAYLRRSLTDADRLAAARAEPPLM